MTQSTFAISLQSVNHVDRGNGVAAALERDFGRGHGSRYMGAADSILFMQGVRLRLGGNLPIFGQAVFGRELLSRHQLGGIALREESGRYNYGISVPTKH